MNRNTNQQDFDSQMIDQSVEYNQDEEKMIQMFNPPTLQQLRNKIIRYIPDLKETVEQFSRQQLQQILSQAMEPNNEIIQSKEENQKKQKLIKMFLKQIPNYNYEGLNQLYKQYGYDQLFQIYERLNNEITVQDSKAKNIQKSNMNTNTYKQDLKNDNLNIYEIKKQLEERMPKYRQEIKNLGQTQLRNFYNQLKNERKRQLKENKAYQDDEQSPERPQQKGPRRRGRPKKVRTQEATLQQMKKQLFQTSNYVQDYGLKSGYDLAGPNTQNQSNYESLFVSQHESPEKRKKDYSPYQINLNQSNNSKNDNKPFCQIILNLDKNNFKTETQFMNIMKILKQIYRTIKKE